MGNEQELKNNKITRVCQYNKLSIWYKGEVTPCCDSLSRMNIGNLKDPDIHLKIKNFHKECSCRLYTNRKPLHDEAINIKIIRLHLSQKCQADCIMCYHGGSQNYDYEFYSQAEELIDKYRPEIVELAGGEVTIQKDAMDWLEKIKKTYNIKYKIITNGCLPLGMIDKIEYLFDVFTVSLVGFQPETYETAMNLDFNKTISFLEELSKRNKVTIQLKYLETPINFHEGHLFLDWAVNINASKIYYHHMRLIENLYNLKINYDFWNKVLNRSGIKMKDVLIKNKELLSTKENYISMQKFCAQNFCIDESFLKNNGLSKTVKFV